MFSKRSCNTENWSNDEENSALHHRNNITFYNILKLKTFFYLFNYISQYCCFFLVFLPNKFSLDEQKIFISESLSDNVNVMFPNFWQVL